MLYPLFCDTIKCDPSVHNESRVEKIKYGIYDTIGWHRAGALI